MSSPLELLQSFAMDLPVNFANSWASSWVSDMVPIRSRLRPHLEYAVTSSMQANLAKPVSDYVLGFVNVRVKK